jgi:superfamily II DNA or RNA helicase
LVVCPTAFGKSFVIKALCMLYPELKILVVSRMGRVTRQLYNKIKEAVDGPVAKVFGSSPKWPKEAKIVVTTIKSLHKIRPDWPDILFFDEAHNAGAYDASSILSNYLKPKLFGFTATPEGRGDNTDLITEAFFGERICDIDYQTARKDGTVSQIHAMLVKVDIPEIDTDCLTTMDKNKHGYWWNEVRNRQLLEAAEKIFRPDESVLYYVEHTEHALFLRLLVPDIPIAHGGISAARWKYFLKQGLVTEDNKELKNPNLDKLEADFLNKEVKRVICTGTWKEGVDFPDLAGLVRFDGGATDIGSAQIVGRLSRVGSNGQKTEAIVIDAEDDFGRRYKDRSNRRQRVYKKNGWTITKLWE